MSVRKRTANVEPITVRVRCPKCHAPARDPRTTEFAWNPADLITLGFPLECRDCCTVFDVEPPAWAP